MSIIEIAGQTDVGLRRKDNQDTFICRPLDAARWRLNDTALLAAIDGVGGYAGGERAAAIANEYIEAYMAEPRGDIPTMLREAVVNANNQIYEERQQDLRLSQMCCVLTVAVADAEKQRLFFVHVGDTRIYRFRQGQLSKLSKDHSLVGIREDAGELTEEEAMNHPRRNEILREVGSLRHRIDDTDFFDLEETDFRPDDLVLLCSDGLTDMLTQAQITAVLNRKISLDAKVAELIKLANQQGGKDNITVVLAHNKARSERAITPKSSTESKTATREVSNAIAIASDEADPEPPTITPPTSTRPSVGLFIGGGVTLLVLLLSGLWYWQSQRNKVDTPATAQVSSLQTDTLTTQFVRLDSLLRRSRKGRLVVSADSLGDTIRLTKPIVLSDSLALVITGPRLVLIPTDTANKQAAFQLTNGSYIQLEGLVIQDFAVGIQAAENVKLSLKDVSFNNVGRRVLAELTQTDSLLNQTISFSVSPLSVPKQTPRPQR